MRVLLTRENCAYELTPVNKRLARQYEKATGHESVLFQTDWDYPSLARNLGWNMRLGRRDKCDHRSTDGTVTCSCGATASEFINAAGEWLDKRVDTVIQASVEAYFEQY